MKRSFLNHIAFCSFDIGKVNAFGRSDVEELDAIIESLNATFPEYRMLVFESQKISPSGFKIFSAGANQKERAEWGSERILEHVKWQRAVIHKLRCSPLCIVSWVDGLALGLGTEICLASDFVLASPDAVFGFPEKNWGIVPGAGGYAWAHGWAIQKDVAQNYIRQGSKFDRDEALSLGIVNRRCEQDKFMMETLKIMDELAQISPEEQIISKKQYHEKIDYKKWFEIEQNAYEQSILRRHS